MEVLNISDTMQQDDNFTMQSFPSVHPVPWTIFLVGYAVVLLTTIGGNTVVIASYMKNEFVRATIANVYILNLSISDILVGLIVMMFDFLNLATGSWPFGDTLCAMWLSAHYFAIYMSVVTVIVISIDRLWLISDVLRYKRLQKHSIARTAVLAVWIYTTLYTVLYSISTNDIVDPSKRRGGAEKCFIATQDEDNKVLSIILENLDFIIPLVLLLAINVTVAVKVQRKLNNRGLIGSHPTRKRGKPETAKITRQTIEMADHGSSEEDADAGIENGGYENKIQFEVNVEESPVKDGGSNIKDRRVIYAIYDTQQYSNGKTSHDRSPKKKNVAKAADHANTARNNLFLLTTIYAACWLPYHILVFAQTWNIYDAPRVVWEILQRLIWFNSMINPFLYAKMNIRFRLGMLKVLLFWRDFQPRINRLKTTF